MAQPVRTVKEPAGGAVRKLPEVSEVFLMVKEARVVKAIGQ